MTRKVIILLLISSLFLAACGTDQAGSDMPETDQDVLEISLPEISTEKIIEATYDFSSDAVLAVELIEAVHPIFILEGRLPLYYEDFREEFLTYTSTPITRTEFVLAIMRFQTALHDLHAFIYNPEFNTLYIAEPFIAREGRLYLSQEPNIRVLAIGGVDVADIFFQIDRHHFHENDTARMLNYRLYTRKLLYLLLAGAQIYYEGYRPYICLTLLEGEGVITRAVGFSTTLTYAWPPAAKYIIRHEIIGDVFLIDLRSATEGPHIDYVAEDIKKAIADGIWKFIIDVRGNSGGSSLPGRMMFEAMGLTMPASGAVRRISRQAADNMRVRGFEPPDFFDTDMEYIYQHPDLTTAQNPNGVFISVLTDNFTASAATEIGFLVADGNFGNIVGEPSANAPSLFGISQPYTLPESQIILSISEAWIERPDSNADHRTLYPDILAEACCALDVALEYLCSLEIRN